jgi:ABC-type Na+ efflux pump permease subunit
MVWKELICTFSGRQKFAGRMVLGLEILLILIVLSFPALMTLVPYEILHRMYIWGLLGLAVLTTAIVSAGVMSTEKEARTWPVLLLTPLTDREILLGKSAGVLRRCGPVWLLLLAYIAGFAYAGFFHPLAVVQMTIVVLTILPFLAATGFYFGLRLHRMTDAVTASLVLAGLLWGVGPVLAHAAGLWIDGLWQQAGAGAWTMVPWSQVAYMTVTTLDGHVNPTWEFDLNAGQFTCRMLVSMAGHLLVALLFAWPAVRAFRRGML